jgi:hypothetical protein
MLLVDNLLTGPGHGLVWVFRKVQEAAEQALRDEYRSITAELGSLYLLLESGEIDEEQFGVREQRLLDRMDELEAQGYGANGDEPSDDED